MKKKFDCVEMKRRGAEKIYKLTTGMTLEEHLALWQERTMSLKKRQQELRSRIENVATGEGEKL